MKKLFLASIVLLSVYLNSCCTKAGCQISFPYKIIFSGFDSTELNYVTIISYTKTSPIKVVDSITTEITKNSDNHFELPLGARAEEYHYKVFLNSLGREYKFDNYTFGEGQKCNSCFPQRDMYEQELKSYKLNGALRSYDKKSSFSIVK